MSYFRHIHALSPVDRTTEHPTVVTDKLRAMFGASTKPERQSDIAVSHVVIPEIQSPEVKTDSGITTAFVDRYVPIPFLHGDQGMREQVIQNHWTTGPSPV